jgi:hypothetical protein
MEEPGFLQKLGRSCEARETGVLAGIGAIVNDRGSRNRIILADTGLFLASANPLSKVYMIIGLK